MLCLKTLSHYFVYIVEVYMHAGNLESTQKARLVPGYRLEHLSLFLSALEISSVHP